MVPQLLVQGLLHLRHELQRRGELGGDGEEGVTLSGAPHSVPTPPGAGRAARRPAEQATDWPGLSLDGWQSRLVPAEAFCLQGAAPNSSWGGENHGVSKAASPFSR